MMQTGKKTLTKREKIFVFGGGTIGLVVLIINFVLLPLIEDVENARLEFDDLDMQWRIIESTLMTEAKIKEDRDVLLEQYNELKDIYIDERLNNELGRDLTLYVREHGFEEKNQRILPISDFLMREGFINAFSALPVTMTIVGEIDAIKSILDSAIDTSYISISRFSFDFLINTLEDEIYNTGDNDNDDSFDNEDDNIYNNGIEDPENGFEPIYVTGTSINEVTVTFRVTMLKIENMDYLLGLVGTVKDYINELYNTLDEE
jgi:hypothetical protein